MKKVFRHSALALVISGLCGVANAAGHPESFGTYSTAVPEDRLFIEDGTLLRCDLFFSGVQSESKVTAAKGSRISQSVPPFVWQYSGLLPVTDYLKTVAIHSVSSMEKERAWQDVQLTFYEGLRAEGAEALAAKVAFAGAYAFAPRWPLVQFIDITVPERDLDSRLYRVEYIAANPKGVTIDEYRSLVSDIEQNTGDISLQDIRGVIDAADAAKASTTEDESWLQKIWRNETPDESGSDVKMLSTKDELTDAKPESGGNNLGMLFASERKRIAELERKAAEEKQAALESAEQQALEAGTGESLTDSAVLPAESADAAEADMQASETLEQDSTMVPVPTPETEATDTAIADQESIFDGESVDIPESEQQVFIEVSPAEELKEMNQQVMNTDEVASSDSVTDNVADDLAAADQAVLTQQGDTSLIDQAALEAEGVVVDLDAILIDESAPAGLLKVGSSSVGNSGGVEAEQSATVEEPDEESDEWKTLPDGTQVIKF